MQNEERCTTDIMTDREKILIIKEKFDLNNDKDVMQLYAALQSGEIQFETQAGRDFDDMIYERAQVIRQKECTSPKEDKSDKKSTKKKAKKTTKKVVVYTKKEMFVRKVIMGVLILTAITCLGYFGFYCYEAWMIDRENERLARLKDNQQLNDMYEDQVVEAQVGEETKYFKVLSQYKSLYNQNKNLIGWLKIADTIIDYPVMQTGDNDYYQNHNINLEEDRNGALFMDTACDVRTPSTNFIIYGHNMRSGKMFGSLDDYESEAFYQAHKTIQFDTIYEEGTYEVMYVFRSRVYQKDEVVFKYYQFIDANSEEEFNSYMKEMAALSFYDTGVTASYGDQLLTLSTCDYEEEDGRFVVVAKRVDE